MNNIFTYNLNDLDKSQISNKPFNEKKVRIELQKISKGYILKQYLGTSYGGDIFLIKNESKTTKNTNNHLVNIKKIICKKINISRDTNLLSFKIQIDNYVKMINSIKKHPIARQFINGIINYKFINNNLYICMPYYKGLNLNQLDIFLQTLNEKNYLIILKFLIKKIIRGLISLHKLGIYHNNLNYENIIINTRNKNMDVKVKFYDLSKSNKRKSFKNQQNTTINEREKKDIKQCGIILLDLITKHYIKNTKEQMNNEDNSLFSLFTGLFKSSNKELGSNLQDLIPEDLINYVNIIKSNMINKQESLYNSLKEILLDEKYNQDNN